MYGTSKLTRRNKYTGLKNDESKAKFRKEQKKK